MSLRLRSWLPIAIIVSLLSATIYISCQQILRLSANDPQIQISQDLAAKLALDSTSEDIIKSFELINMTSSLSLFVIIYNSQGQVVESSVELNGHTPIVPFGVLQFAQKNGQNRITWMPQPGIRNAIVVTPYQNDFTQGYVLVGRSLKEVENRSQQLLILISLANLIILGISYLIYQFVVPIPKKTSKSK